MKLEIRENIETINVLGTLGEKPSEPRKREVYLDGKRVPEGLETIILTGLDAMTLSYARELIEQMECL